jgi:hypothetical protein
VWKHVSRCIQAVDAELRILDPDVHVSAENQQAVRKILQLFLHAEVALERRRLLLLPR